MAAAASPFSLPRARLPALQQLPLDSITVYDTATHCYLLGTDSLQKNFHLLSCRKHSAEQALCHNAISNSSVAAATVSDGHQNATVSESEAGRAGAGTAAPPSASHAELFGLDDLHDFTSYAVYSPTEAGALVDALRREHGPTMRILPAVAFLGAVRFTAGYYVVLATERRMAGYLGVHRLFEAVSVELVSLQLDPEWVAAAETQARKRLQQLRRGGGVGARGFKAGYSPFISTPETTAGSPFAPSTFRSRPARAGYGRKAVTSGTGASVSATSYIFQRRSLEELYRQQFITSLSRASSFFYSHSYDLTNTLQRNMLAAGTAATDGAHPITCADNGGRHHFERRPGRVAAADARVEPSPRNRQPLQPRMQYVWNEYLLEPWQRNDRNAESVDAEMSDIAEADVGSGDAPAAPPAGRAKRDSAPQYPSALSRWYVFLVHGYITQRAVVVRQPAFRTLLITLIARVSKASAGVRYLRRGLNSDGHVANHVEVEQIISDESSWNSAFTAGTLTSYVQLRGSVPVRWYHPPTASRLLPKPPIVIGPHDSQWSETCLHFQHLLEQYGAPILVHDLLKRRESNARESVLGDAYRAAVRAMVAAVDRWTAATGAATACRDGAERGNTSEPRVCGADVLQYESTDLRSLSQLAWNTMTAVAEQHFSAVRCFVSRRCCPAATLERHAQCASLLDSSDVLMTGDTSEVAEAHGRRINGDGGDAEVVQLQRGVVRSNCLDCIDRTNLGQLFHGLHALGEQLSALGLLRHAADVCDSPAVTEMLLEMYLAMGDAIATQYGGSAQVGAGVLHRGAGWDQLMGVKRLYHNVMGDRDKQEAMNLLLGRKQPQPRRGSRACNAEMHSPGQMAPLSLAQTSPSSTAPSLSASITSASPAVAAALAGVGRGPLASEDAVTPSASFFSGIRQTASRWWSEATSSASSSGAAVAAAEAEAEADYYEQVSSAPRLPLAGLLTSWWVQPLRRFDEWCAACGASALRGATRNSKMADAPSVWPLGAVATPKAPRSSLAHSDAPFSSPASTLASSTSSRASVLTSAAVASAGAYGGDELALRLLAAETQAQERWKLFIANVERQACLAPARRDAATQLYHDRRRGVPHGDGNDDTAAAPSLPLLFSSVPAGTPASDASAPSRTMQWSLVSSATSLTARAAAAAGSAEAGALSRAGYATVASAELAPLPPSAPLLAAPPCLFAEPWVLLRTTMHVLPVESVAASECRPTRTSTASAAALCSGGFVRSGKKRAAIYSVGDVLQQEPPYSVGQAVARQLLGCFPPAAAVVTAHSRRQMLMERHQPWRSPQEVHPHDAFPSIVRNSAFALQNADLERLAYREMLWIVDGVDRAAGEARGVSAESLQSSASPASMAQPSSLPGWPWTLSTQEVADRQFIAALLVGWFGAPATWGLEDMVRVVQRLVYPEPLPVEVLQVLRSSRVQPPLEGAELLFAGAPARAEEGAEEREQRVDAETRQYWHERLAASVGQRGPLFVRGTAAAAFKHASRPTAPRRDPGGRGALLRRTSPVRFSTPSTPLPYQWDVDVHAGSPVQAAVALLCRLTSVLRFAAHDNTASGASVNGTGIGPVVMARGNGVVGATSMAAPWSHVVSTGESRDGASVNVLAVSAHDADAAQDEGAAPVRRVEEALLPLLEECPNSGAPASAYLPGLFPEHETLPDSLRRQWLLCRLLQPIFARCALTPPTLHSLLRDFFAELLTPDEVNGKNEQRQQRRRREYRVRYSFVLPQQHGQLQQQPPQGQSPSLQPSGGNAADGAGGRGDGWYLYNLFSGRPTSLSSSSPQEPSNVGKASSSPTAAAASRTLNIPATLKVRHCCSALDLYRWSVAHCPLFVIPSEDEPSGVSVVSGNSSIASRNIAAAAWHLLWWAIDNNFLIPVVRRRGQATLEMLADETALFCVKRDVARVALNVERRCHDDVWRPQQPEALTNSGKEVPGSSAIYGVDLAPSMLRLHRPLRRSALAGILTLSENLASLGLRAATQVQEFFRVRTVHGWVRQSLGASSGTTVALFGGRAVGATGVVDSSPVASASSGSSAATAAAVVRRFHRLAVDCLQSVQSAMAALQHMSLEVLARDAAMHDYISFFVNVYNAAYVAAWLTNVKELVGNGAAAATADTNSPAKSSHHQHQGALRAPIPRTIDLFPLPTLCNTSYACFMHAYGVVIGGVFVSLEEMKYGILGGNRAPPHCDLPLWPPIGGNGANPCRPSSSQRSSELDWQQQMQRLVPLHLRADVPEAARINALRRHPHLQEALDFIDMCEALAPSTSHMHDACAERDGAHAVSAKARLSSHEQGAVRNPSGSCRAPSVLQPSPAPSLGTVAAAAAATDSARRSLRVSSSLPPDTSSARGPGCQGDGGPQPRRRHELVDVWSVDVVRYLPFRILLQLIDTYLPPPVLHLCAGSVDAEWKESSVDVTGDDDGSGAAGSSSPVLLDGRDRVPWYLQPIFNPTPLVHTALQSSKLGATYAVAHDGDGPAAGMLTPQVSQDANGVLLQPSRMWSSPSYYVVGGDGISGDEAVSHSFQLLQALAGSYLGAGLYHPISLGTTDGSAEDASPRAPTQHLCLPLHSGDAFTQLRATEAAFRSALLTTDPHLFCDAAAPPPSTKSPVASATFWRSSQPPPLSLPTASSQPHHLRGRGGAAGMHTSAAGPGARLIFGGSGSSATSCSATLQSAMKPLLYEWCRSVEKEMSNSTLLSQPGWQMRVTLQMVRLLEESYASGRAVRAAQAAMQSG
ncbi:putative inositol polyphosphate phosphatase [Leishmania infantum JPCM5]|uniref:Inositol_polyphosphate_phosphatase_-_putative n=2 Tax=Leishmania infantum TaxID=5671 RepID=A0A6L0XEE2_LEIIN|nr:putative inositol polyphosphate phosphatase [Leishmania infantum JPCM5]CAC9491419.1 inositol_polyphosphate_phosphatase_-_putative [Leishmania infantum]CAM68343.1 putative inositol polyphosphate phosphatase [Leishmania infantum JPCM5]SUZ42164.1 inositol_polyphosphate_phosphatase_-_putative [Leishmania infantum]|eukprot:XP_001465912.1 putative inositol polyphosphate phosphatase [Leishmania infantum JPCM5]